MLDLKENRHQIAESLSINLCKYTVVISFENKQLRLLKRTTPKHTTT
jgi:hypothetical protein